MTECRAGCGACCIAPSITTPFPGMPHGKPAGVRCVHLTFDNRCTLFGHVDRPAFCNTLMPSELMCGSDYDHAMGYLVELEAMTLPTR